MRSPNNPAARSFADATCRQSSKLSVGPNRWLSVDKWMLCDVSMIWIHTQHNNNNVTTTKRKRRRKTRVGRSRANHTPRVNQLPSIADTLSHSESHNNIFKWVFSTNNNVQQTTLCGAREASEGIRMVGLWS